MLNKFVLDCSITMSWCFEDETTPFTELVLESLTNQEAIVPSLWALEVVNVLIVAEKKTIIKS